MAVTYNIKGTSNPSFKIGKNGVILSPADNTSETTITLPNTSGTVVLQDSADTLSNKTLASPTFSGTVSGSLAIANTTTDDSLLLTTTEDSSSAGPVITLKRNSSSPADADYLGQLKFKGENDADQEVVYAKITGKIQDATDTTEDGIIEFANRKAGSNVITARLRSDSLQLLNSTGLTVAGDTTLSGSLVVAGDLTVQGTTTTVDSTTVNVQNAFVFEGATADNFETTLTVADPTADRTITLPNVTGTVATLENAQDFTAKQTFSAGQDIDDGQFIGWGGGSGRPAIGGNKSSGVLQFYIGGYERLNMTTTGFNINANVYLASGHYMKFEGTTNDDFETILTVEDPTADRTVTLPDESGTVVVKDSNTGAIQLPVGTTAQRPASPSVGMVRYNTTTNHFEGYDGSAWVHLETQYG